MIKPSNEGIVEISKSNWAETRDVLISLYKEGYDFRGHKCGSWLLQSSFERKYSEIKFGSNKFYEYCLNAFRTMSHTGIFETDNILEAENNITLFYKDYKGDFSTFANIKYPKYIVDRKPNSPDFEIATKEFNNLEKEVEYIVWKMQHHGVLTHLLDTTTSYYIAVYFSLFFSRDEISSNKKEYPSVIALRKHYEDNHILLKLFKYQLKNRSIRKFINNRINKQQAKYINSFDSSEYNVRKIFINPFWIKDIFQELYQMNINGETLFGTPDMVSVDFYNFTKHGHF